MIKKWGKQYNRLIESILSLSVLNSLNILLPLITLPYILRMIGPARFGIYSFSYVLIQYILLISTYGFNFSATKQISQCRNSIHKVNIIYNTVTLVRLILAFISFCLFSLFTHVFFNEEYSLLLLYGIGIVLGDIFIPVWLFQGMEKMKFLAIINVISKMLFTLMIFFVVHSSDDYIYVMILNSFGYIIAGVFSTIIAFRYFKLSFYLPIFKEIKYQFIEGYHVFCSTLSMNLYRNSNIFILGIFMNDTAVGIYSSAEKVIKALQSTASPVAEALFPHLGYKFVSGTMHSNILLLMKILKFYCIMVFLLAILTYIAAPYINILFGKQFEDSIILIRLMSPVIFLGGGNYILGIVGLINLGEQKSFLKNVIYSGMLSIIFVISLIHWIGIYAAALSMIVSELVLSILCSKRLFSLYKIKS